MPIGVVGVGDGRAIRVDQAGEPVRGVVEVTSCAGGCGGGLQVVVAIVGELHLRAVREGFAGEQVVRAIGERHRLTAPVGASHSSALGVVGVLHLIAIREGRRSEIEERVIVECRDVAGGIANGGGTLVAGVSKAGQVADGRGYGGHVGHLVIADRGRIAEWAKRADEFVLGIVLEVGHGSESIGDSCRQSGLIGGRHDRFAERIGCGHGAVAVVGVRHLFGAPVSVGARDTSQGVVGVVSMGAIREGDVGDADRRFAIRSHATVIDVAGTMRAAFIPGEGRRSGCVLDGGKEGRVLRVVGVSGHAARGVGRLHDVPCTVVLKRKGAAKGIRDAGDLLVGVGEGGFVSFPVAHVIQDIGPGGIFDEVRERSVSFGEQITAIGLQLECAVVSD